MNQKITVHQLAENIADICGCDTAFAEKYLKTVTEAISDQLCEGNTAVLKQIGSFSLAQNDTGDPIEFNSDPELANLINSPFDMFESVELHESVTDEMLDKIDSQIQSDNSSQKQIPDAEPVVRPEPQPEPEPEQQPEPQPKPQPRQRRDYHLVSTTESITETETESETESETFDETRPAISWQTGLIIGIILGLIIGAVTTYIYVTYQIDEARAPYEDTYTEQTD